MNPGNWIIYSISLTQWFLVFFLIDVFRGPWGGKNCRDSPIQSPRDCNCKPNECQACDNYVNQVQDVLVHSMPKGVFNSDIMWRFLLINKI